MKQKKYDQKSALIGTFARVADDYNQSVYLAQVSAEAMIDRLKLMITTPDTILDIGCGTGIFAQKLQQHYPQALIIGLDICHNMLENTVMTQPLSLVANACFVPVKSDYFDLITINLGLYWGDFEPIIAECSRLLKVNGLLLFSTLGPDTLKEVRQAYHRHYLIDMHHLGDQLLQLGFTDPVMETEQLQFEYHNKQLLQREYQALGLQHLIQLNDTIENQSTVTFEMIYGHAWRKLPPVQQDQITIPLSSIRKKSEYGF
ncbi:MAG: methyltransferase domain-containing protein [Pseudomonadota bacterium]